MTSSRIEEVEFTHFHLFCGLGGAARTSDHAKRERIGNAVPPYAAQAVADLMGETLLLAKAGETFMLSALPVWVRPVAVALSVSAEGLR